MILCGQGVFKLELIQLSFYFVSCLNYLTGRVNEELGLGLGFNWSGLSSASGQLQLQLPN